MKLYKNPNIQIYSTRSLLVSLSLMLVSEVSSCSESEPEVIKCLKSTLINSVNGTIKEVISLMNSWEPTEKYGTYLPNKTVPESLLNIVPKEWNYIYKDVKTEKSGKCKYLYLNLSKY